MKIDSKLNFVIPVESGGETSYVHAEPIKRDTFERYFEIISKTFTAIYAGGLGIMSAPRVAAMMMKKIAKEDGVWEGPEGVSRGLFAEMRRLTNVVVLGPKGWASIPFEEAIANKKFSDDDYSEVENAVAFFTVASSMHKQKEAKTILTSAGDLWSAQVTPLNVTEYAASLPTSIETETSKPVESDLRSLIPS